MYHVSTHGADERIVNVHYYYYFLYIYIYLCGVPSHFHLRDLCSVCEIMSHVSVSFKFNTRITTRHLQRVSEWVRERKRPRETETERQTDRVRVCVDGCMHACECIWVCTYICVHMCVFFKFCFLITTFWWAVCKSTRHTVCCSRGWMPQVLLLITLSRKCNFQVTTPQSHASWPNSHSVWSEMKWPYQEKSILSNSNQLQRWWTVKLHMPCLSDGSL